jgi:hypothetical protein
MRYPHLVGKTIYDGLARDGGTRFEALKKEAMQRINAIAGTNLTHQALARSRSIGWLLHLLGLSNILPLLTIRI